MMHIVNNGNDHAAALSVPDQQQLLMSVLLLMLCDSLGPCCRFRMQHEVEEYHKDHQKVAKEAHRLPHCHTFLQGQDLRCTNLA